MLGTRDGGRELLRDGARDPGLLPPGEPKGEDVMEAASRRAFAFFDMVLPLSRACRRRPLPALFSGVNELEDMA